MILHSTAVDLYLIKNSILTDCSALLKPYLSLVKKVYPLYSAPNNIVYYFSNCYFYSSADNRPLICQFYENH